MPTSADEELDKWAEEYDKWKAENGHLPNLQPSDVLLSRLKQQRDTMQQQQQQQSQVNSAGLEKRISLIEDKLDRLIKHLGVPTVQNPPITISNTPPAGINTKDNSQKDSKSNKKGM